MSATTVKLESKLLREIAKMKAPAQTLASFVREAVENDLRRRRLRAAAEAYQKFLSQNPAARQELEEWETADLSRPAKKRKRR